ncbi:MAG: DUF4350 domain-containing protein [Candidatus Tectomicrobia bacterium]
MISTAIGRKFREPNFLLATVSVSLCLVLLYALASIGDKPATAVQTQRSSSFFTHAAGTRAIYLVLKRLLPAVEQWRRPLAMLASPTAHEAPTTLIVLGPSLPLAVSQARALDDWMRQGGQVILATHRDWPTSTQAATRTLTQLGEDTPTKSTTAEAYVLGHGFTIVRHDADEDAVSTGAALALAPYRLEWEDDAAQFEALVTTGEQVVVGSKRIGSGRLVVVPDAAAFSNQRIRQEAKNAVWLVTLCATWGNGRVLIDEFYQGFGSKTGLLTLVGQFLLTPWGWVCIQSILAGGLYLFGSLRRFGRISDPSPAPRRRPAEMLEARGGLLAAAQAKRLAVELMHQQLHYRIGKSVGYPVHIDDAPTRARLAGQASHVTEHFEAYMPLVEQTLSGKSISDRELVRIGRLAAHISEGLRKT